MGIYLNPGCEGFRQIRKGIYVDKTGLIDYINSTIETAFKLTVVSRPRRFGKSFAAKMLCAYYDKSCNSRQLFDKMEISKAESFEEHLNQYNVIYLDITRFISRAISTGDSVVLGLQMAVIQELREAYPECIEKGMVYLPDALNCVSRNTGDKFIIIIDEWDALFREAKNSSALLKEYVQLLRGLFKGGTATDDSIAAAYMTGILPIKKYGTQSALTDFQEYTMTNPDFLSVYVGFTEDEVRVLCSQYNMDFEEMKHWYDGYSFYDQRSVYNPNSVISAIRRRNFRSYWTETETYESLKDYITENFDGLKDAIVLMLGGQRESVYTGSFQNDMTSFKSKDDILTLLIHLGYLAYDGTSNEVYIPNQEVADAFQAAVRNTG
ncbi:MAG: AAA family ATPase [Lachnospiraceae bacterium]|nr:AAA family ATPase [Lachnospiraceae bacterium]